MLDLLVITLCVIYLVFYFYDYYFGHLKNLPPGPKSLPILGSFPFLPNEVIQGKRRMQLWIAEEYGPIASIQSGQGRETVVFISDFEIIKEFLKRPETSHRPIDAKPFHELRFGDDSGNQRGLLQSNGEEWLQQRRFANKHLREFGFGKSSMEDSINNEVEKLAKYLMKDLGKPINLNLKMNLAIVNALWYILVGENFELEDEKLQAIVAQFDQILRQESRPSFLDKLLMMIHPKLTKLFNSEWHSARKLFDDLIDLIKPRLDQHKAHRDPHQPRDFMDAFLAEIERTEDRQSSFYGKRGEESMIATMIDLFLAGAETTTSSLLWAILCLLHYPDVQERVQAELDQVVGPDRKVSLEDRPNLPFTNAVLMEAMRIATITPMALPHSVAQDMEFGGYRIPKNAIIFPNILQVHYDPNYWDNPDEFMPSRFYDKDSNTFKPNDHLIPFSVGRRLCLGQTLAEKEYFLFFCGLLQKFNFKFAPGKTLPGIGKDAGAKIGILRGVPLHEVVLSSRDRHHIRPNN